MSKHDQNVMRAIAHSYWNNEMPVANISLLSDPSIVRKVAAEGLLHSELCSENAESTLYASDLASTQDQC